MCPPFNPTFPGSPGTWRPAADDAAGLASSLMASFRTIVKSHLAKARLAQGLWRLDRSLARLLSQIYEAIEKPDPSLPPATGDQVKAAAEVLVRIHGAIDSIYADARREGLTNTTLVGMPLNSAKQRAEELLEIAEWLETWNDPGVNRLLDEAIEDARQGRTLPLSSIFE